MNPVLARLQMGRPTRRYEATADRPASRSASAGRAWIAALLGLLAVGGCSAAADDTPSMEGALRIGRVLHVQMVGLFEEQDPLQLGSAADLMAVGERLFITESFAHRVSVVDTALNLVGRFGSRGQGPGELLNPFGIHSLGDTLLGISELNNGRVSFFTLAGEFSHFIPDHGSGSGLAVLNDSTLVVPGRGGDDPRVLAARRMGRTAFAAPSGDSLPTFATIQDQAIVVHRPEGTRVVVLRRSSATLEVFDGAGLPTRSDTLDQPLIRRLVEDEERRMRAFQRTGGLLGRNLISRTPRATSDGRVLLPLGLEEMPGLVYDPISGEMQPVSLEQAEPEAARFFLTLTSGHLYGDRLYVLDGRGNLAVLEVLTS